MAVAVPCDTGALRAFERRNQLGAAAAAHLLDGANRRLDIGLRGGQRLRAEDAVAARVSGSFCEVGVKECAYG